MMLLNMYSKTTESTHNDNNVKESLLESLPTQVLNTFVGNEWDTQKSFKSTNMSKMNK